MLLIYWLKSNGLNFLVGVSLMVRRVPNVKSISSLVLVMIFLAFVYYAFYLMHQSIVAKSPLLELL